MGTSRIVDLSLPLRAGMRGVDFETAKSLDADGWNARTLHLYSHCGTHMDAPRHFDDDAGTLDDVDLAACIGPARLIDLTPVEPRELITPERLAPWADAVGPGDRLLLRTDWSLREGTPAYRDELPRVSAELAEWFAAKGIALLGVEPPSVADVHDLAELQSVHRTLLSAGIVIVEGLANLDRLASDTFELIVLPLPVAGGDGSPCRAVAVEG